jgi:hypothetical protein
MAEENDKDVDANRVQNQDKPSLLKGGSFER